MRRASLLHILCSSEVNAKNHHTGFSNVGLGASYDFRGENCRCAICSRHSNQVSSYVTGAKILYLLTVQYDTVAPRTLCSLESVKLQML